VKLPVGIINIPKLQSVEPHVEEPLFKKNTMIGQVFSCNFLFDNLQVDTFLISSNMHMGISTNSPLCSNLSLFVATVVFARICEGMLAKTVDKERERVTTI
jgi:hypothetical protein